MFLIAGVSVSRSLHWVCPTDALTFRIATLLLHSLFVKLINQAENTK